VLTGVVLFVVGLFYAYCVSSANREIKEINERIHSIRLALTRPDGSDDEEGRLQLPSG
jgi:hypothetical protein